MPFAQAPPAPSGQTAPPALGHGAAGWLHAGGVAVVAHRGASGCAPENTLAAVRAAVDQGAPWVEVDVRRTADGALVLLHDRDLRRTTDVERVLPGRAGAPVGALALREVRRLDAGSWGGAAFAGEPVPLLEEVLALVAGSRVGLLLEVKEPAQHPGVELDVAAALRRAGAARPGAGLRQRVVVQSFDHAAVRRFASAAPGHRCGLLTRAPLTTQQLDDAAEWVDQVNPWWRAASRPWVAAARERGLRVHAWTVDDPRAAVALVRRGVDGVITDHPLLVADALARHAAGGTSTSLTSGSRRDVFRWYAAKFGCFAVKASQ